VGFEVVGVGHCAADYLGVVEAYPAVDSKIELSQFSMQGGGPVATALVTLSTLGVETSFIGKISDDEFGRFIHQGLRESGVDTRGLVIEPGFVSPFSFIAVESRTGKRTVFWTRGDLPPLLPQQVRLDVVESARVLHVDGLAIEAQLHAARHARARGITVVFDAGSPREGMDELLGCCDVLIASERFAAEYGGGALGESLKALRARGPKTVVITIGSDGSVGIEGEETYVAPAHEVEAVDTTGAGDVYHGAFIYGMLRGMKFRERMHFANVAAALKCRALGGRAGIPTLEEIDREMGE
jgi:ribokinase